MLDGYNRWIFEDPVARKIRLDLREAGREWWHESITKVAIGLGAATSTFMAGVKILDLGTAVWRIMDMALLTPVLNALTVL